MRRHKINQLNRIYIHHERKESLSDLCVKYIPLFLGCFLFMSFLFNLGYFIPSSHQYITFLSYADYFEGTMPFIVIHIILATFVFTQPFTWLPKLVEDFEVYIKASRKKDCLHQIIYKKIKFESFIGYNIQQIISNSVIQDEYYHDPIKQYEKEQELRKQQAKDNIGKRRKLKKIIVKIKKIFKPIKKILSLILFMAVHLAILLFIMFFICFSVLGCVIFYILIINYLSENISSIYVKAFNIVLTGLYIYAIYQFFLNENKLKTYHLVIIILCFYAPLLGELKFLYDWKHPELEVLNTETNEKNYLIRAISNGYFVKDSNTMLYLPKDNIQNISLEIKSM